MFAALVVVARFGVVCCWLLLSFFGCLCLSGRFDDLVVLLIVCNLFICFVSWF